MTNDLNFAETAALWCLGAATAVLAVAFWTVAGITVVSGAAS